MKREPTMKPEPSGETRPWDAADSLANQIMRECHGMHCFRTGKAAELIRARFLPASEPAPAAEPADKTTQSGSDVGIAGSELPDTHMERWFRDDGDWIIATASSGDGFAGLQGIRIVTGRVGIDLPRGNWHKATTASVKREEVAELIPLLGEYWIEGNHWLFAVKTAVTDLTNQLSRLRTELEQAQKESADVRLLRKQHDALESRVKELTPKRIEHEGDSISNRDGSGD
jgi:hypothetical protein